MYGTKAALALLSDQRNRSLFDRAEPALIDGLLPWTRLVRDEKAEVSGERVDLLRYAPAHWEDQRRVRPVTEDFPAPGGGAPGPAVLTWGVFLAGRGYGGAYLRGTTEVGAGVISSGRGGRLGTLFLCDDAPEGAPRTPAATLRPGGHGEAVANVPGNASVMYEPFAPPAPRPAPGDRGDRSGTLRGLLLHGE
ncbi:hypothetical protein GCM10010302_25560 [Streptomyces polychromogenes]|uniref:Uncharacterized protein n=1 Tax=Streptomyces polychromogenes TaxID=67342 RepID=A0ABP3F287_9ACTN